MVGRGTFKAMGRALPHRNNRFLFQGPGTSLIGTRITRVATGWLVYRLTGSALLLGLVGFAGQIPTFLLAPFAGVFVDRRDRRRVLLATQVLSMLQSAALAALALTGTITVESVLALQICQGLINAFDMPARQSMVVEMIESRDDLPNAIALNSSLVNGSRLVGPAIAGVLIAAFGEGWCFALDAASYVAVIASLQAMRLTPRVRTSIPGKVLADLRAGFRYAAGFAPIRSVLLLLAMVSFTGMPYTVLMPVFARRLGGGPDALGLLMGAIGLGAVTAALWLASRTTVLGLGRILVAAGTTFGVGLVLFAWSRWMWVSVPLLALTGAGMMVTMAGSNTLLQTLVDEDMRGRVMSFYAMAFFGMTPFGSLAAGWAGDRIGAPATVAAGGVMTLVAVGLFALRLPARPRIVIGARPGSVRD
jgi:MFS family permease